MIFLIIMISLIAHVSVGTAFTRKRYAQIMTERSKTSGIEAALEQANIKLAGLRHGVCNLNYSTMVHRGCDCGQKTKWRSLKTEISQLEAGLIPEPGAMKLSSMVMFWPIVGYISYLKGASYIDYAAIERMENEMEEIQ